MPEPEDKTEEKTAEELAAEQKTADEAKQQEWDKERQKVDQLTANVTKMAEEKTAMSDQLTGLTEQNQSLVDKLDSLESKLVQKQTEGDKVKLDSELVDPNVIKAIENIQEELSETKQQLNDSNTKITDLVATKKKYEDQQVTDAELERKTVSKERILSSLDKRYGAKYRNEALNLAQKDVDEVGKPPEDVLGVYLLLEPHYIELAKNDKPAKTKETVPVDDGAGGVVFDDSKPQEGTRKDLLKGVREFIKKKGKSFTMPDT